MRFDLRRKIFFPEYPVRVKMELRKAVISGSFYQIPGAEVGNLSVVSLFSLG